MDADAGYRIRFEMHPEYLHATVTGRNTRASVLAYLEEVRHEARTRGAARVLIEERLEGRRLGSGDVYEIASSVARLAPGELRELAYVDVFAEGNLMQFAADVSHNLSHPVMLFGTVAQARAWLLDRARGVK